MAELLNALRMEKRFPKGNPQFYLISSMSPAREQGVAIAARYFFNKELKDLTLAECAFIAGP